MSLEADLDAVVTGLREGSRFLVTSHENPDGDALGSLLAMHLALQQLGKDSVMMLAGPPRCRGSTASSSPGARARARATWGRRRARPGDRGLRAGDADRRPGPDRRHRLGDQHRPPPRQHALRDDEPRGVQRFVHGRGARRPLRGARRAHHAGDRGGAVHGPRHRHGSLPVHQHDRPGRSGSPQTSSRPART